MEHKFLDYNGLLYLWGKLKSYFVKAEDGKGLSTNDYTTADRDKLNELKNYELPEASAGTLGGIKVGSGLTVTEGGVLSANQVSWDDVQSKPEDFPAKTHKHTAEQVTGLHDVATSGKYTDLTEKPDIPSSVSELDNDLEFQTASNVEATLTQKGYKNAEEIEEIIRLKGYQTEAQVEEIINGKKLATQEQVTAAVANAHHLKRSIVSELPAVDSANEDTIYMVLLPDIEGDNRYTEWMVVEGKWEKTGDSDVILTDYVKSEDLETISNHDIDAVVK